MSSDIVIDIRSISKAYHIYEKPQDRLKQAFWRGAKKYYKDYWALKDVSLKIKSGETVGIIGRNGSGKSTLLQLISGTLRPTAGNIYTRGKIAPLLELGAGFNPEFTGRENIHINAAVLGLSNQEIATVLDDIIAFADIGNYIDQPVKTYSSGMFLRLAFGVVAHVKADILIIDEALAVGDVFFRQKCMRFLREFQKYGTILFVSHDSAAIRNLCERAVWIDEGVITLVGSAKEVTEAYLAGKSKNNSNDEICQAIVQPSQENSYNHNKLSREDQRLKYINQSKYRNDIELFDFDPEAKSFGKGGVKIVDVLLMTQQDKLLSWIVGGETVALHIEAKAKLDLNNPIIGFYVKDRLGQYLFGDNTYFQFMDKHIKAKNGDHIHAIFEFTMPIFPVGDYSIDVAVSDGTMNDHIQHEWIHDAITFKSHASSSHRGLIGIQMNSIELEIGSKSQ